MQADTQNAKDATRTYKVHDAGVQCYMCEGKFGFVFNLKSNYG